MKVNPRWNPKHFPVSKSENCPGLETEVWAYLVGRKLELVISVNKNGIVMGQTMLDIRLPKEPR